MHCPKTTIPGVYGGDHFCGERLFEQSRSMSSGRAMLSDATLPGRRRGRVQDSQVAESSGFRREYAIADKIPIITFE